MSKLIGRKPVEVNISSPKQNHIPFFNESTRLWETRDINGFITGSNTFIGDQTISGSLFISGNVLAKNLQGIVSSSNQVTGSLDFRYVLVGSITQTTWDNIANRPVGIVSGSSQLTSSYDERYVLSGSITQTTWTNIAERPAGIVSGSSQLDGTTINSLTGSFNGTFVGDGSGLSGIIAEGSGVQIQSGSTILGTAGTLRFTGSNFTVDLLSSTASISIEIPNVGSGVALDTVNFAQLSQSVAADTWSFVHNLENSHPVVTVYDSNNQVLQPLRIEAISNSTLDIVFSTPRSGYAVASIGGVSTMGTSKRLTQSVNSATWSFQHNVGDRYPVFEVYDTGGNVMIPSRIETIDSGLANIYFPYQTTGIAIASVGGGLPSISSSYEGYTLQVQNGFPVWESVLSASVASAVSSSNVLYSNVGNKPTLVSGSTQITLSSTMGYSTFSSSLDTRLDNLEGFSSSLNATFATDAELSSVSGAFVTSLSASNADISALSASVSTVTGDFSSSVATSFSQSNYNTTLLSSSIDSRLDSIEANYATTGSNTFRANQTISGSLFVTENLVVFGSSSLVNITGSSVNIGTNTIVLNTSSPSVRFGGISVIDSGSTQGTGSLWWDSERNHWLYEHPLDSEVPYNSAILISGPKHTGSLGGESGLVSGSIVVASGDDHIDNSIMSQANGVITLVGDLVTTGVISGSIAATNGVVSGSSQLTSSYDLRYVISGSITQTTWDNIANKPSGIISGATQVTESLDLRYRLVGTQINSSEIVNLNNIHSEYWTASVENDSFEIINDGSTLFSITTASVVFDSGLVNIKGNSFANDYAEGYSEFGNALIIEGNEIISGALTIAGTEVVSGSLLVSGAVINRGTTTISGSLIVSGTLNLENANIDNSRYLHVQSTGATTWTVNHNLSYDYPSVTIWDSTGNVIIPDSIIRVSNDQLTIGFISNESGWAHVSVGGISTGQADRFLYTQATEETTWTINHGLNYKYVNVNVYDDNDEMLLPETVTATNANTTTLVFAIPTSGNAILSKGGARTTSAFIEFGNGVYGLSGSLNVTGSIVASGDVDAQNFNTTSDVRLKTNLEVITGALDKVEQLNAYTYDWIEEYNNEGVRQIGLVSQEVQKVQPELVHEKEVVVGNMTERMLLLDYSKVTTLLIGAVKELSEKVKQLENKIGE
jgi:hypothetical protein